MLVVIAAIQEHQEAVVVVVVRVARYFCRSTADILEKIVSSLHPEVVGVLVRVKLVGQEALVPMVESVSNTAIHR